jgi:hypothetical protein
MNQTHVVCGWLVCCMLSVVVKHCLIGLPQVKVDFLKLGGLDVTIGCSPRPVAVLLHWSLACGVPGPRTLLCHAGRLAHSERTCASDGLWGGTERGRAVPLVLLVSFFNVIVQPLLPCPHRRLLKPWDGSLGWRSWRSALPNRAAAETRQRGPAAASDAARGHHIRHTLRLTAWRSFNL